jgi:hypothetical protein
MFKKILVIAVLIAVIGVLVVGAINRTQAKTGSESTGIGQGGNGQGIEDVSFTKQTGESYVLGQGMNGNGSAESGSGNGVGDLSDLFPATQGELSADESAALLYMREEEKLAHDVYVTFYAQWSLAIFQNISQSEQIHTDAIKTLLDRYGLNDPASTEIGIFTNPDLQALCNDLIARGSQSLAEALKVGAAIEEIDILETDNTDIQQVYANLMNGSYNHLRAFVSALNNQTGETYQPQYLSTEVYEELINANTQTGGSSSSIGNGRGGYHGSRP